MEWGISRLNENNFSPRTLYPAKLSFKIDRAIKIFHDKQKLKQYMTTKPPTEYSIRNSAHRRWKQTKPWEDGIYQTTGEEKTNNQRVALFQLHRINSLNNKNNQMTGITTYLSILILNVNELNSPIKRHCLANRIKKEELTICYLQEAHLIDRNKH
jgi:hypothetical protein